MQNPTLYILPMAALFIGRFQPFHLGHLDAIKQTLKKTGMLYIGIGSADNNFRPDNPLTVGERIQLVKNALDESKIPADKYLIIAIPNINNYELWPFHVEQHLPPFDTVFTSSETVKALFENANKNRKKPFRIIPTTKNLPFCSTKVRKAILENQDWGKMVPTSTKKLLKSWKIRERLLAIQETEK